MSTPQSWLRAAKLCRIWRRQTSVVLRHPTRLGLAAVAALGLGWAGHASAVTITSSYLDNHGHNGVTFRVGTTLTYTSFSSNWNPTYADAYIYVFTGDARCDRNRLFENSWSQFVNKNWAGSPFPIAAGTGYKYDYFNHNGRVSLWSLRSRWQVDDKFVGGVCDYGGGTGLFKSSHSSGYSSEVVPGP